MLRRILLICLFSFSLLKVSGQDYNLIERLVSNQRASGDGYGTQVDIHGSLLIVSAPGADSNQNISVSGGGVAFIYRKDSNDVWSLEQKISPTPWIPLGSFGTDVTIYNDFAAVSNNKGSGQVFIFKFNGVSWVQSQILTVPSCMGSVCAFGKSLDLYEDFLVIGDPINGTITGAVFFYENVNGTFIRKSSYFHTGSVGDRFGFTVSIDSAWAVVGSGNGKDSLATNYKQGAGAAYIFKKQVNGTWQFTQRIVPSDRDAFDYFSGRSVSVSGDFMLIGAYGDEHDSTHSMNTVREGGSAYLFKKNINNKWVEKQKLSPPERWTESHFGNSVSLHMTGSNDGFAAIGQPEGHQINMKKVHIYKLNINGKLSYVDSVWNKHGNPYDSAWTDFGEVCSISNGIVAVGNRLDQYDENLQDSINLAGSVSVFNSCINKRDSDTVVICFGDSVLLQEEYQNSSGQYICKYPITKGCDSIVNVELIVWDSINNLVSNVNDSLFALDTNVFYQWIECSKDSIMINDTLRSFKPAQTGNYAVVLTSIEGCVDTSDCISIIISKDSIPSNLSYELVETWSIEIYPNPTEGYINVELPEELGTISISMINSIGKLVETWHFFNQERIVLHTNQPSGIYSLLIFSNRGIKRVSIIIE